MQESEAWIVIRQTDSCDEDENGESLDCLEMIRLSDVLTVSSDKRYDVLYLEIKRGDSRSGSMLLTLAAENDESIVFKGTFDQCLTKVKKHKESK